MNDLKANELRIGNWVNDIGSKPFQIMPEDILAIALSESKGKKYLWSNPIEITEEWLLKLGAIRKDYGEFRFLLPDNSGISDLTYNINSKSLYIWGGDAIEIPIQHVHRIQNLYFVLTNKELTIVKTDT